MTVGDFYSHNLKKNFTPSQFNEGKSFSKKVENQMLEDQIDRNQANMNQYIQSEFQPPPLLMGVS